MVPDRVHVAGDTWQRAKYLHQQIDGTHAVQLALCAVVYQPCESRPF